jgi:hypothetical protein
MLRGRPAATVFDVLRRPEVLPPHSTRHRGEISEVDGYWSCFAHADRLCDRRAAAKLAASGDRASQGRLPRDAARGVAVSGNSSRHGDLAIHSCTRVRSHRFLRGRRVGFFFLPACDRTTSIASRTSPASSGQPSRRASRLAWPIARYTAARRRPGSCFQRSSAVFILQGSAGLPIPHAADVRYPGHHE